ncbi:MAG: glucose-6-phosphate dehydrogenase, partial [Bacteroidales bacterium]|nr:glucose-6-phosphate dehydrogenase [Bacteroidales bacterium]
MFKPPDHILIIFGASGDLTRRKLIPALRELQKLDLLPERFAVLGIGRTNYDDGSFREMISQHLEDPGEMLPLLYYQSMDPEKRQGYDSLGERLAGMAASRQMAPNYIFYLATPPGLYGIVPLHLSATGLTSEAEGHWRRIIIEKPFGSDYQTARDLNISLLNHLNEDQIYRIDHYLGKETVQNVLVTRFSNGIFEPLWNRNFIHHVEITSSESLGVGTRGGYYDHSGALRDMLQNH